MDAWSPEQLKKMQLGGNDALNAFLKGYGVDKYTEIRDKYNTQAAEVVIVLACQPCQPLLRAYLSNTDWCVVSHTTKSSALEHLT